MSAAVSGIGAESPAYLALRPQSALSAATASSATGGSASAAAAIGSAGADTLAAASGAVEQDIDAFLYDLQTAILRLNVFY